MRLVHQSKDDIGIGLEVQRKLAPHVRKLLQALLERREPRLPFRIVRGDTHEYSDAPHALALLRARRERPCRRCAAEERDELAPSYVEHGASPPLRAGGASNDDD
jgi:hypothetical protein